jgi:predicted ATPase
MKVSRLSQVKIQNYKNIAAAVVELQPLTILVGPNGAGKSNFVDALSFAADSLNHSVQKALSRRGGLAAVRPKSGRGVESDPTALHFEMVLADGGRAEYVVDISASAAGFKIARERCVVGIDTGPHHEFEVQDGEFTRAVPGIRPRIEPDRLALTVLSAAEEFRPVYDFLSGIRHYNPQPQQLYEPAASELGDGDVLLPDLRNAAMVLRRISEDRDSQHVYERICRLLGLIVPGITRVQPKLKGGRETLEVLQKAGEDRELRFEAHAMSDGTLRVLGILLALYQPRAASVVIIEEPEATIHPAALEVLIDVLIDGTARSQILVTTHSPDVLDSKKLRDDQILTMESVKGAAQISPLANVTRDLIRERLYTAGELLRQDELHPDPDYPNRTIHLVRGRIRR